MPSATHDRAASAFDVKCRPWQCDRPLEPRL